MRYRDVVRFRRGQLIRTAILGVLTGEWADYRQAAYLHRCVRRAVALARRHA